MKKSVASQIATGELRMCLALDRKFADELTEHPDAMGEHSFDTMRCYVYVGIINSSDGTLLKLVEHDVNIDAADIDLKLLAEGARPRGLNLTKGNWGHYHEFAACACCGQVVVWCASSTEDGRTALDFANELASRIWQELCSPSVKQVAS